MGVVPDLDRKDASSVIETSMFFMKRDALHAEEKPYAYRYAAEIDIPQSNFALQECDHITIKDIRGHLDDFSLEENGVTILNLTDDIPYEDFFDEFKVEAYFRQLEAILQQHLQASLVQVFRHALRKRDPSFPISTGEPYEYDQPTSVAHVDTTTDETLREVRRQHGDKAEALLQKRIQWINIWKPLRGPLSDWPLAFCDSSNIVPAQHFERADLLYPEFTIENSQVYYSPQYRWHYLSKQQTNELIVFKQSDTDSSASPGVPHLAFNNPHVPLGESPRESIEVRALVFYD